MIGIFDSGVGGFCAYQEARRLLPRENILYLADRKNAPYGTKSEDEIIALTRADIKRLKNAGARKILIACCTASSIHHKLDDEERQISLPIITPAAEIAAKSAKRILVIATEHTAKSSAFKREIAKFSDSEVFEIAAQRLVSLVEGGCRDGRINEECRRQTLGIRETARDLNADCLILGCTHFPHLQGHIAAMLPGVNLISPSREGALEIAKSTEDRGGGRTVFL